MALKLSHSLAIMLSLSLLLSAIFTVFNTARFSVPDRHIPMLHSRRALATKFDFKPFMRWRRHRRQDPAPAAGSEFDPRYGDEKRLVPTGPNPLHH
ncbi:CLAVATA3/ESR (CLE)-related protein 13 [Diospyros lotus]|uniref:CLAVATA3/ESR (CLE)-related protein 13 n=1 Tax=Diospyros lotus TaxID=55363 RepID=UPI00224DA097|nr:CLAVATA3/ESR (CLE)-related protein 13 [Diospyros lotus]